MLLLMLERGWPIDAVLNADTGMEFPEMYEHLRKLDEHLYRERGIHITTLKSSKSFEYLMFDEPKQKPSCIANRQLLGVPCKGNGWPGIRVRWCTGQLKTHLIGREINRLKQGREDVQSASPPTRQDAVRAANAIRWSSGALPKPTRSRSAMTVDSHSAGFMRYTGALPAGAARSNA